MNKGRNLGALKVRRYLQLPNMQQQFKLVSIGGRNALVAICYKWERQVRHMNGSGAAMYAIQLCSIQNSNQTSAGLGLRFEGSLVQMGCNFIEIWARF
jgi:hypothetical protein